MTEAVEWSPATQHSARVVWIEFFHRYNRADLNGVIKPTLRQVLGQGDEAGPLPMAVREAVNRRGFFWYR